MLGCSGMAHQVGLTLSLESVVHHSLTAAPRHGPRRPDEEPDEWVGERGPEALGQTEESRRHAAAQIGTSLLAERSCRTFTHHYSFDQPIKSIKPHLQSINQDRGTLGLRAQTYVLHCTNTQFLVSQQLQSSLSPQL